MIKIESIDSENSISNLEYVDPEIWKDIEGYEGKYQVSNKGRVRSLSRTIKVKNKWGGISERHISAKILKQTLSEGYPSVRLYKDDGGKQLRVHRLVAEAFINNSQGKPCINHKDSNKGNNYVDNLEWATYSENLQDAYDNELRSYNVPDNTGSNHGMAKLTETDVIDIRNAKRLGCFTNSELADAFNVSRTTIWEIVSNKSWTHV